MPPNICFYEDNVISNGGFETGFTGWSVIGAPTTPNFVHPFNDGINVARLVDGDRISQTVDVQFGRMWVFGAYFRFTTQEALDDQSWYVKILYEGEPGDVGAGIPIDAETGDYLLYQADYSTWPLPPGGGLIVYGGISSFEGTLCGQFNLLGGVQPPPVDRAVTIVINGPSVDAMYVDVISLNPYGVDNSQCYNMPFDDAYTIRATPSPLFKALEGGPNPNPLKVQLAGGEFYYDENLGVVRACPGWFITEIDNPRITVSKLSDCTEDCLNPLNMPVVSFNSQGLQAGEYSGIITVWGNYGDVYEVGVLLQVLSSQGGDDEGGIPIDPPETIDVPCLIVATNNRSPVSAYYVRLLDTNFTPLAIFDDWRSLDFTNLVNDVGNYSFEIWGDDERCDLFGLDYIIEVWRSLPGLGVDWYREFVGFHRGQREGTSETGDKIFISYGVGLNDLLARTSIAYLAGTIDADKDDYADNVIKEYVEQNCGPSAITANGRIVDGALPGFSTAAPFLVGVQWAGSRAFENLLDVVKEVAGIANFDFEVTNPTPGNFHFRTYPLQLGRDRTDETLDASTGLNADGSVPVVFDVGMGNVQDISYELDRSSEINVVIVPGKGEGATRDYIFKTDPAKDDSPWNRREMVRPGGSQEFEYQLEDMAAEELKKLRGKERFDFTPLQTPLAAYGRHYFLGDRVNAVYGSIKRSKRIVGVSISVSGDGENIKVQFADKAER